MVESRIRVGSMRQPLRALWVMFLPNPNIVSSAVEEFKGDLGRR